MLPQLAYVPATTDHSRHLPTVMMLAVWPSLLPVLNPDFLFLSMFLLQCPPNYQIKLINKKLPVFCKSNLEYCTPWKFLSNFQICFRYCWKRSENFSQCIVPQLYLQSFQLMVEQAGNLCRPPPWMRCRKQWTPGMSSEWELSGQSLDCKFSWKSLTYVLW